MRAGFIGLGTMGASMALNLQAKEHEVAVHDLRRDAAAPHLKAGATWANGPREIAEPRFAWRFTVGKRNGAF